MPEDERAIRTLIANWLAASRSGDLPRVLSLMAEDVLFLVSGRPPFGKAEFAASSAAMKDMRVDGKSEVLEVVVQGDWAWCRTQLSVSVTPPRGTPIRRSGQTLSIQRAPEGHRALRRRCFTSPYRTPALPGSLWNALLLGIVVDADPFLRAARLRSASSLDAFIESLRR